MQSDLETSQKYITWAKLVMLYAVCCPSPDPFLNLWILSSATKSRPSVAVFLHTENKRRVLLLNVLGIYACHAPCLAGQTPAWGSIHFKRNLKFSCKNDYLEQVRVTLKPGKKAFKISLYFIVKDKIILNNILKKRKVGSYPCSHSRNTTVCMHVPCNPVHT